MLIEKKYGYYRVRASDGQKFNFSSKIEALEFARRTNGRIHFHFNDEVYSRFDWTVDIPESISELYRQRAQQLRDKYDQVVVMYSGGYDSANVLNSFVDNDIHVDAIVSFYYALNEHNPDCILSQEWNMQTWPRLQRILPQIPHTEIIKLDLSEQSLSAIDRYYDDYIYASHTLAPNTIARSRLQETLPLKYQEKSTCFVYGVDKPRLRYKDGRFYFNFVDLAHTNRPLTTDSGYEYFYWTPDAPKIVIKQAQIAKRYWQANLDLAGQYPRANRDPGFGLVLNHDHDPVQRLIYPSCQDGPYLTWRPKFRIMGGRDVWIFDSNTEHGHKLQKIMKSFLSLPREWFQGGDPQNGMIGHVTRDYVL